MSADTSRPLPVAIEAALRRALVHHATAGDDARDVSIALEAFVVDEVVPPDDPGLARARKVLRDVQREIGHARQILETLLDDEPLRFFENLDRPLVTGWVPR